MNNNILYIVGNGFDLKHGMPTKYSDFKQWLVENGRCDVIHELQKAFPIQKEGSYLLWSDFETSLGQFDIDVVLNWSWEDLYLTEYSIGGQLFGAPNFLLDTRIPDILSGAFTKWVGHILLPTHPKYVDLKADAYYLTFNYTDTLETLYGIPDENIIHIHGRASLNEKLVVGHNRVIDPSTYWDDNLDMRENNERMQRLMDMNELHKPCWEIIERNRDFFNKLGNVRDVYIMGHSCTLIDLPYFRTIKESIDPESIWHYMPYGDDDVKRNDLLMNVLRVDRHHRYED